MKYINYLISFILCVCLACASCHEKQHTQENEALAVSLPEVVDSVIKPKVDSIKEQVHAKVENIPTQVNTSDKEILEKVPTPIIDPPKAAKSIKATKTKTQNAEKEVIGTSISTPMTVIEIVNPNGQPISTAAVDLYFTSTNQIYTTFRKNTNNPGKYSTTEPLYPDEYNLVVKASSYQTKSILIHKEDEFPKSIILQPK